MIDTVVFIRNIYSSLRNRNQRVIDILKQHGIEKGDSSYTQILNQYEYSAWSDYIHSALHSFGENRNLTKEEIEIDQLNKNEKQKIAAVQYLEIDGVLQKFINNYILGNNRISEDDCLAVAGMFSEAEINAVFLGLETSFSQSQRKKAKQKGADKLSKFIYQEVVKNPSLTESGLLALLITDSWIESVTDSKIKWKESKNKAKDAPMSGLKDRLFRAKQKYNSR